MSPPRTPAPGLAPLPPADRQLAWIYGVTATLVLCHEIDSAAWAEWDLFHLPGGAPLFVALHLLLVPLVLAGGALILRQRPAARLVSLLVGAGGVAGGLAHTAFLVSGDPRFSTPLSLALVAAFGLASAVLVVAALRFHPAAPSALPD